MRFSAIQHQSRAISILRRSLSSGRTHHAYLFDGPEGVGKALTARALAARLLCDDAARPPDADACGTCESCRLLATDNHPDFHVIHRDLRRAHPDPKVRRGTGPNLVIDVIRHFLIKPAGMKPTHSARRVFLIDEAERMKDEAQNALLKTLEEPPGDAVLILVSSSAFRLLPTIRSRCQRIPFDLLPPEFVAQALEASHAVPAAEARALAQLSGGRLGVALHWWRVELLLALDAVGETLLHVGDRNPEAFAKALLDIAAALATRTAALTAPAPDPADADAPDADDDGESDEDAEDDSEPDDPKTLGLAAVRESLKLVLMLVAALYREALLEQVGAAPLRSARLPKAAVEQAVRSGSNDELRAYITAVAEAEQMIDRNVTPQLACERLAVALLGELPVIG